VGPARAGAQALPDTVRWSAPLADQPSDIPVISGPAIVVPLRSGRLAAHRLSDGEPMWTIEIAAERPLAADDEQVYVASGEAIHALKAGSGAVAWRVAAGGPITAAPLARGGWLIVAAGGELIAVRASDGTVMWRTQVGAVAFRPALDGDLLVASVTDGRVVALNVEDGARKWEFNLASEPTEPFVIGGRVYVGTAAKRFVTLRASSGRLESRREVGAVPRGRAAVDEQHIYFAAVDNLLWTTDVRDGAIEWRKPLPYRPTAGPVLLGGVVIVPGEATSLPAFNARTGAAAGQVSFPARLAMLPVLWQSSDGGIHMTGVTGGLDNKWMLTLMGPLTIPPVSLQPLTALPGEVVPLQVPPTR
jgi:outer membrane protein assembly factor BamB